MLRRPAASWDSDLVDSSTTCRQLVWSHVGSCRFPLRTQQTQSYNYICRYVCVYVLYTRWGKIKYPNTKIAISQKCLNIFAPNFAHLFGTILCTKVLLCAVFTRHVKLMETQTSRTKFTTEQKVDFIIKVTEHPSIHPSIHKCIY